MALRDDLLPCIDDARQCIEDLGLRLDVVTIRTRTFSGSVLGDGSPTDVDVVISPRPKVAEPGPRYANEEIGKYEEGDRIVSKIDPTMVESDFTDAGLAANQERYFIVGIDAYQLVGEPQNRNFEWRLTLRRMRHR